MPSFRASLQIKSLRPGNAPEAVMDTAVAVMGSMHLVEANRLDVVAGVPVITLRFLVEASSGVAEDQLAADAGELLKVAIEEIAVTGRLRVFRRDLGKWLPVTN